jgi:cytochrome oxidase assembly protein ShyY1
MFVAGWAVNALDIDNSGSLYFVAWLALAVGLIGIATVVLVPRAQSRQRRGLVRRTHRS